jgi:NAD(P)-dependent dehydrogenase (short-subunit alcohol dehydrogenase family)
MLNNVNEEKRTMRFQGKVALVTGGGASIGRATALRFAEEGADVVVADVVGAAAEDTAETIRARTQQRAIAVQCDVSCEEDVARMVSAAEKQFGQLNVVFHAAGIFEVGRATELAERDWERQIDVNLKGTFLCAKHAIPAMIRSGGGSLINAASVTGLIAYPNNAAYCAAKGGVVLLTKNLALDYARDNIRVNCICPAGVDGPMMDRFFALLPDPAAAKAAVAASIPMGRMCQISEVVEPILFLASDAASFITGSSLLIDGGVTAT